MPLTQAERQKRARQKRKGDGMVRLDIPMPGKLHRQLRTYARKSKLPMKAIVISMLWQAVTK